MGLWGTGLCPQRAAHQDAGRPRRQASSRPSWVPSGSALTTPSLLGCPRSLAGAPDSSPSCTPSSGSLSTASGQAQTSPSSKMLVTLPAEPLEPPSSLVFVPCFLSPSQPRALRRKEGKALLLRAHHGLPHHALCPSGGLPPVSRRPSSAPFLEAFGS